MKNMTVRPINTGYVPTYPLQYHYHHSVAPFLKDIPNEKVPLPVFTFLVEGGDKLLLVDTGMAWTERANDYHHPGSYQDEGLAIHEQLEKIGLKPEDIDIVVFTHLHWDHCYNVEKFTNARLYASEIEYRFALDPIPFYWNSYEAPALGIGSPLDGMHFSLTQGEEEIVEGIGDEKTLRAFSNLPYLRVFDAALNGQTARQIVS